MKRAIKIIFSQKRPMRFIVSMLLCKVGLNKLLYINREGYKLHFFNSSISKNLWIDNKDRVDDEIFFKDFIHENDFIVDVGSNIGNLTITAAKITQSKNSIYSFEANKKIFDFLNRNIELNGLRDVVRSYNIAIGDTEDFIGLTSEKNDGMIGVNNNAKPVVKMSRLETLVNPERKISLLKIDVEGFELMVLKGAKGNMHNVEAVYFEYNSDFTSRYNYQLQDIVELLNDFNMDIYEINIQDKTLVKLDHHRKFKGTYNFLAYNKDKFNSKIRLKEYKVL